MQIKNNAPLLVYNPSNELAADEIYVKIKGVKSYVWLIMDKVSRFIRVCAKSEVLKCSRMLS